MNKFKKLSKPNFKKHSQANFLASIAMGVFLFLASIASATAGLFGFGGSNVAFASSQDGSSSNPYVVTTASQLLNSTIEAALKTSNKHVVLGTNINLGNNYLNYDVKGVFDGAGYTITSNRPFVENNLGVIKNTKFVFANQNFGTYSSKVVNGLNSGTLQNLEILNTHSNVFVNSIAFGGFAKENSGNILQVINRQSYINTSDNSAGTAGVVGLNRGNIENAVNNGDIRVVGLNKSSTYNAGAAGGIAGATSGAFTISKSYNAGDIYAGNGADGLNGRGIDGGNAGGIVGFANNTGKQVFEQLINYGSVFGGNGGAGANGVGGAGGLNSVSGKGGAGGFGGGNGGNAGGIIGAVNSTASSVFSFSATYNSGALVGGIAGRGGYGGAGGGGAFGYSSGSGTNSATLITSAVGNSKNAVGGKGMVVRSNSASLLLYGAGGGGSAGANGSFGLISETYANKITSEASNGVKGNDGGLSSSGTGGGSGSLRGQSAVSSASYSITSTGQYEHTAPSGGNGGLPLNINIASQNRKYATKPASTQSSYSNLTFTGTNGWVMGSEKPELFFEDNERQILLTVRVIVNNVQVNSNIGNYISLREVGKPTLKSYSNVSISSKSSIQISNTGNYIYKISGVSNSSDYVVNDYGHERISIIKLEQSDYANGHVVIEVHMLPQLEGNGSEQYPYLLGNANDFVSAQHYIASKPNASFKLYDNVTLSTHNSISELKGKFDGGGHTINLPSTAVSLFKTNNGTISNLKVSVGGALQPSSSNSAVIAEVNNGVIENVVAEARTATNVVTMQHFGAIAAINNGKIVNSSATGEFNVSLSSNPSYLEYGFGGLVGLNTSQITQSFSNVVLRNNTTSLSADKTIYLAGIAGINNNGKIENSYSLSNINQSASGAYNQTLLGIAFNSGANSLVSKTFASGQLNGSAKHEVANTNHELSYGATQMQNHNSNSYNGWELNKDWILQSYISSSRPVLRHELDQTVNGALQDLNMTSGQLAAATDVQISSIEQLDAIFKNMNTFAGNGSVQKTITITNDINAKGYNLNTLQLLPSSITLNGNNKTISYLNNLGALVEYNAGTIKNLHIQFSKFEAPYGDNHASLVNQNHGAIVGVVANSAVVYENVVEVGKRIGGLVAYNSGTISNSAFNGAVYYSVSATGITVEVGGIAAINGPNGLINNIVQQTSVIKYVSNNATPSAVAGMIAGVNHGEIKDVIVVNNENGLDGEDQPVVYGVFVGRNFGSLKTSVSKISSTNALTKLTPVVQNQSGVLENIVVRSNTLQNLNSGVRQTTDFATNSAFAGFNFNTIWHFSDSGIELTAYNDNYINVLFTMENSTRAYIEKDLFFGIKQITSTQTESVNLFKDIVASTTDSALDQLVGAIKFKTIDPATHLLSVTAIVNGTRYDLVTNEDVLVNYAFKASQSLPELQINKNTIIEFEVKSILIPYQFELGRVVDAQTGNEIDLDDFGTFDVYINDVYRETIKYGKISDLKHGDWVRVVHVNSATTDIDDRTYSSNMNKKYFYDRTDIKVGDSENTNILGFVSLGTGFEFQVGENRAAKLTEEVVKYTPLFGKLYAVTLASQLENYTKVDENDYDLEMVIDSILRTTSARIAGGTSVSLYAPQTVMSGGMLNRFTVFTSDQAVINHGIENSFVVSQDTHIIAEYSNTAKRVEIAISESSDFVDFEYYESVKSYLGHNLKTNYNGIILNYNPSGENEIITDLRTNLFLEPGQIRILMLSGRKGVSVTGLKDSPALFLPSLKNSIIGASYEMRGGYVGSDGNFVEANTNYVTYNGQLYTEIVLNIDKDYVGNQAIQLAFEPVTVKADVNSIAGNGSQNNPFIIANAVHLATYADIFNNAYDNNTHITDPYKYFEITNSFSPKATFGSLGEQVVFVNPIATNKNKPFAGNLIGNGNTISDLSFAINVSSAMSGNFELLYGLFGATGYDTLISDFDLANPTFISVGANYAEFGYSDLESSAIYKLSVGAVVGYNQSILKNIVVNNPRFELNRNGEDSVIAALYANLGGIAGINDSTIESVDVVNTDINAFALVSGNVGGIVGINLYNINDAVFNGKLRASGFVGGLVGYHAGAIYNSYTLGEFENLNQLFTIEKGYLGGLVGVSERGQIYTSYSRAKISGKNIAGLVGLLENNLTKVQLFRIGRENKINYNYFVGELSGENFVGIAAISSNSQVDFNDVFKGTLFGVENHNNNLQNVNAFATAQGFEQVIDQNFGKHTINEMKDRATYSEWFGAEDAQYAVLANNIGMMAFVNANTFSQEPAAQAALQNALNGQTFDYPITISRIGLRRVKLETLLNGAVANINTFEQGGVQPWSLLSSGAVDYTANEFIYQINYTDIKFDLLRNIPVGENVYYVPRITIKLMDGINIVQTFTITPAIDANGNYSVYETMKNYGNGFISGSILPALGYDHVVSLDFKHLSAEFEYQYDSAFENVISDKLYLPLDDYAVARYDLANRNLFVSDVRVKTYHATQGYFVGEFDINLSNDNAVTVGEGNSVYVRVERDAADFNAGGTVYVGSSLYNVVIEFVLKAKVNVTHTGLTENSTTELMFSSGTSSSADAYKTITGPQSAADFEFDLYDDYTGQLNHFIILSNYFNTTYTHVVTKLTINGVELIVNEWDGTSYGVIAPVYVNLLGNVGDTQIPVLDPTRNGIEIYIEFEAETANLAIINQSENLELTHRINNFTYSVGSYETTVDLSGGQAYWPSIKDKAPLTIKVTGATPVANMQNAFMLDGKLVRFVWVAGRSSSGRNLISDHLNGLHYNDISSYVMVSETDRIEISQADVNLFDGLSELTIYVKAIELKEVTITAGLHSESFGTTRVLNAENTPAVIIDDVNFDAINKGYVNPGAKVYQHNGKHFVDRQTVLQLSANKDHFTTQEDINFLTFNAWEMENLTTEHVVDNEELFNTPVINSDININAGYNVKTISIYFADNVQDSRISMPDVNFANVAGYEGMQLSKQELVGGLPQEFDFVYNGRVYAQTYNSVTRAALPELDTSIPANWRYSFNQFRKIVVTYDEAFTISAFDTKTFDSTDAIYNAKWKELNLFVKDSSLVTNQNPDGLTVENLNSAFTALSSDYREYDSEGYVSGFSGVFAQDLYAVVEFNTNVTVIGSYRVNGNRYLNQHNEISVYNTVSGATITDRNFYSVVAITGSVVTYTVDITGIVTQFPQVSADTFNWEVELPIAFKGLTYPNNDMANRYETYIFSGTQFSAEGFEFTSHEYVLQGRTYAVLQFTMVNEGYTNMPWYTKTVDTIHVIANLIS